MPKQDEVKAALEEMPYGLYIVGSKQGDHINAMIADWLMQVSFSPRLVAIALENDSRSLENIRKSGVFSASLLAEDSMNLAAKFAQPYKSEKIKGRPDEMSGQVFAKMDGVDYILGETGCPILEEAIAWIECKVDQELSIGDHALVVGLVLGGGCLRDAEPMTSNVTGWVYGG